MKKIYFILMSLFSMFYVIYNVKNKKFSIKESFWWVLSSLIMVVLSIFPYSIDYIAKVFGVSYPPSLLFVFCIVFLLFINFRNSKRISEQQMKIIELEQNLAILKEKNNHKDRK